MTIRFRFLDCGAFVCGDAATGLTAYAYPSSTHAESARRRSDTPDAWALDTARKMLVSRGTVAREEYDLANWWRINTGEEPGRAHNEARARAFDEANRAERAERLRLMERSPCRQSAKARAGGRAIAQPADVDGLALFDKARSPSMF